MIKIEIHTNETTSFNWQDKKGSSRTGYKQSGWAHLPDKPFPVEIQLRIDEPSKAYQAGVYTLDPKSFWVDRFGSLAVSPVLIPAATEQRKAS